MYIRGKQSLSCGLILTEPGVAPEERWQVLHILDTILVHCILHILGTMLVHCLI